MTDPATVPALLRRNRDAHGAKPVMITEGASLTHAQLDDQSRAQARCLVAAGIKKGARVGLMAPNGIEWAVTAAAVLRIGAVLVPLSTLLRPPELAAQLEAAAVSHLIVAREFRGRAYLDDAEHVAPGVASLRCVWALDDLPKAEVDDDVAVSLERAVSPSDDMVVLFTSGSRGAPKGTIHTHSGALGATASGLDARCVHADERLYVPMPFFWTGGFSGALVTVLVAGATLLTESIPDPEGTLDLLERHRVTLFRGWPDQAGQLAAHPRFSSADLSSLRRGSLPGVLPPDRRPAPGARANLFGMTETFGPYCGDRLDLDLPAAKHGSCGRPFAGIEVGIVDPDSGAICAAGATGEIRVRGPNVMRGICGRTSEETFDAGGFYPTGDLGALDADGYLWYRGRLDDMFKVKGATVYPAEVEAALRSVELVRQAHVTNVGDGGDGNAVGALVVSSAPLDELVDAARARLSAFKVPTWWLVMDTADEVPLTATSKVDKPRLQELLHDKGERVT